MAPDTCPRDWNIRIPTLVFQLYAYLGEPSQEVKQAVGLVPAAILAALILPVLFPLEGSIIEIFIDIHAVAGGVAAVVAWRTGSIMGTIVVGMLVLWGFQFLLG